MNYPYLISNKMVTTEELVGKSIVWSNSYYTIKGEIIDVIPANAVPSEETIKRFYITKPPFKADKVFAFDRVLVKRYADNHSIVVPLSDKVYFKFYPSFEGVLEWTNETLSKCFFYDNGFCRAKNILCYEYFDCHYKNLVTSRNEIEALDSCMNKVYGDTETCPIPRYKYPVSKKAIIKAKVKELCRPLLSKLRGIK